MPGTAAKVLEEIASSRTAAVRLVQLAKIVLLSFVSLKDLPLWRPPGRVERSEGRVGLILPLALRGLLIRDYQFPPINRWAIVECPERDKYNTSFNGSSSKLSTRC